MLDNMVKVLQIAHGMETFGGVESFLLQYHSHMNMDIVQCDYLFCCNNTFEKYQDNPIFINSKIIALNDLKTTNNTFFNYIRMVKDINKFLIKNKYNIIHINTSNIFLQFICAVFVKRTCVKIAHSHSSRIVVINPGFKQTIKNILKNLVTPICQYFIRNNNDYLLACSKLAGIALFGRKGLDTNKFRIVKNAIKMDAYLYNEETRNILREKYNIIEKNIIYGTVGRLAESKNLLFLIDIFNKLHLKNPNSLLWIIGDGPMRTSIEKYVKKRSLDNVVFLLGEHDNVADYLQAMDCFIFPTVYEGLGIVAIEAQAASLITVVSDAVPEEAKITELCYTIPLSDNAESWAKQISTIMETAPVRREMSDKIIQAGYDINSAAKELEMFYLGIVNE